MSLEVPDGLTPKPVVSGDELIFAFRASDGTPIKFTPEQLFATLLTGARILAAAPNARLSPDQFSQPVAGGNIYHNESWLTNFIKSVGAAQGWASGGVVTPKLATPVITFGASTSSSNKPKWTASTGASYYTLQRLVNGAWSNLYVGNLLEFTDGSLPSSTTYQYRVFASATGYLDSDYGTGSATTTAATATANFMADFSVLDLTKGNTENHDITQNPTGVFYSGEIYTDYPAAPGNGMAIGSVIAFKYGTKDVMVGLAEGADNINQEPRVYVRMVGTVVSVGTNQSGDNVASVQPSEGDFILLTCTSSAKYDVSYRKPDGTVVAVNTLTMSYNLLSTNPYVKFKLSDNGKVYYPQGKGLTTWVSA